MKHPINIAIDGPSGVGKSTISNRLSERLHMKHLDTGAMYRCVALYLKQNMIPLNDTEALNQALAQIHILFRNNTVELNGQDVTKAIRMNDISMFTSQISALPAVRAHLVRLQQEITKEKGYIVDGRDIGSVVLPDAEIKIYLDATVEARAQRRYKEYVSKHIEADYQRIYEDIQSRDYQDMHRQLSPLTKTEDAIVIDTSFLSIDAVVNAVVHEIEK